jgi:23S rRNA (uracil1939-C5)-methyltransferase
MTETTLTIDALGHKGEGIAPHEGGRVFVPYTLPGETVTARITGDRAEPLAWQKTSPERITPECPHFGACGGCQLQHLSPAAYRAFKIGLIETPLRRLGLDHSVAEFHDASGAGRRRATLHARREGAGYMKPRSHQVEPIETCPILAPSLADAPRIATALGEVLGECDIALTATDGGIDAAIRIPRHRARPDALSALFRRLRLVRLAINGEPVLMAGRPAIRMGRAEIELPVDTFLQATEAGETLLADYVLRHTEGARAVADLFCGLGPFALRLAERGPVHAFDSDKPAIAALARAAPRTRGLKPVTARARDLFREPLTRFELDVFDCLVLDPPRAGAQAQIREIAQSRVPRVVMLACDAQSFARDAAILVESGFALDHLTGFDQFAWSSHVEIGAVFTRSGAKGTKKPRRP